MTETLNRDFDEFLFSPVGTDISGMPLTVISVLARLDLDPWAEAAALVRLPFEPATQRLAAHIAVLPAGGSREEELPVTAGSAAIRSWKVTWTWPNGQRISNAWNATVTSAGETVTATNAAYNGAIAAGASTSWGFLGSYTGSNTAPTITCAAA